MSTPTPIFDPEDPKLTAYALGELLDPTERTEVELLLQGSPEARAVVQEIKDFTLVLTAEYDQERRTAAEPVSPLPSKIIDLANRPPERRWSWVGPLLAAAALLVALVSVAALNPGFFRGSGGAAGRNETVLNAQARPATVTEIEPAPEDTPAPEVAAVRDAASPPSLPEATTGLRMELALMNKEATKRPESGQNLADFSVEQQAYAPGSPAMPPEAAPVEHVVIAGSNIPTSEEVRRSELARASLTRTEVVRQGSVANIAPASTGTTERTEARYADASQPAPAKPVSPQTPHVFRGDTNFYRVVPEPAVPAKQVRDRSFMLTAKSRSPELDLLGKPISVPFSEPVPSAPSGGALRDAEQFNTAAYDHLTENAFLTAKENPLSTFSVDVDTASYANVRRFIDSGSLPPTGAVRIEEMINYFPYDYAPPAAEGDKPFAVHLEAASCPWAPEHRLVRVGLKGKEMPAEKRPPSNLVFLLDVSGSMMPPERLPLIKKAMSMMVEHLADTDRVAIVTYAGNSGLVLPSTDGAHKDTILAALDRLEAGGSTNGASGIELAYKVAKENFIKGGTNRVILSTDGDFNVGTTDQDALVRLVQEKAKGGVFLSALGVGTDNYKDSTMQKLADKGNGNYNYLDRLEEARKVLVDQMGATLVTIAKDVKIQVEFNPAVVTSYRLIGYEKRMLRKEDFNDDKIDAGEIGAGHSVTALYEVVPIGQPTPDAAPAVDALKYATPAVPATVVPVEESRAVSAAPASSEMLTVKLRHKAPDADKSEKTYEVPLAAADTAGDFGKATPDFRFAAAVAEFGLALRNSPYKGSATLATARELGQEAKGSDAKGYRAGFVELVHKAESLQEDR